jgi:hypothetical protein
MMLREGDNMKKILNKIWGWLKWLIVPPPKKKPGNEVLSPSSSQPKVYHDPRACMHLLHGGAPKKRE